MKAKRYHVQLNLQIDALDKQDLSERMNELELLASILDRRHNRKFTDEPHIKPSMVKHIVVASDEIDMELDDWQDKCCQDFEWISEHHFFQAKWRNGVVLVSDWIRQKNHVVQPCGKILFTTDREVNLQDEIDIALVLCADQLLKTVRCFWDYTKTRDKVDRHIAANEAEKALAHYDGLVAEIEHDHKVKCMISYTLGFFAFTPVFAAHPRLLCLHNCVCSNTMPHGSTGR